MGSDERSEDEESKERVEEDATQEEEREEGEEVQIPKTVKPPIKPTKEEVNEHMISHLPFRTWCAHCVKGKSKSKAHRRRSGERTIPTVSIDYTFMSEHQGESEEKGMPILVVKDSRDVDCGTGMIFARVVPRKGAHQYAIKRLAGDIEMLGHSELVLKSDGEPAITALKEAVKRERGERIVLEAQPV